MFNVMKETELMDINGGMWAVPYYASWEDFTKGKSRGYAWTSSSRVAYAICTYYYDANGNCVYWYNM